MGKNNIIKIEKKLLLTKKETKKGQNTMIKDETLIYPCLIFKNFTKVTKRRKPKENYKYYPFRSEPSDSVNRCTRTHELSDLNPYAGKIDP